DDLAIGRGHQLPWAVGRRATRLGSPLVWKPGRIRSRRSARGIERPRNRGVVVASILLVEEGGILEPVAAEVDLALAAIGALEPQSVILAAPASPGVEGCVDQGRRVALGERDADRYRVRLRAGIGVIG